jgi:hypothetical protein
MDRDGFAFDAGIFRGKLLDPNLSFECEFCPPHLAITPYPARYVKALVLSDGTPAVIRTIKPED